MKVGTQIVVIASYLELQSKLFCDKTIMNLYLIVISIDTSGYETDHFRINSQFDLQSR